MKTIIILSMIAAVSNINCNLDNERFNFSETGTASYYADFFEGRLTASGDIFSQEKLTAAHKTLPFGTEVLVENLSNARSIVVTINDRGPFVKNRIIDLSSTAARELGFIEKGIQKVRIKASIDGELLVVKD